MKTVSGVLTSCGAGNDLVASLRSEGVHQGRIVLLTPAGPNLDICQDPLFSELVGDELFIYEDALSRGLCVVIALAENDRSAEPLRRLMDQHGALTIDSLREQWWLGLRAGERQHYAGSGREFDSDEMFYRLGFQSALHARTRGKEYDQVLNEMAQDIEDLETQYPDSDVEEPFRRGYERGRAYAESGRAKSAKQARAAEAQSG